MERILSPFSQEELLGRPSPPLSLVGAEELIGGRRVAITGAAGSVGGPLARVIAALRPDLLLLIDHHEHSLFRLRTEMTEQGGPPTRWVLADIRDHRKMERVFRDSRPEVIFHLAAYKHVPLGEENPDQTVEVNLLGTRVLVESAAQFGAVRFVYPSSDKAVDPPSVYGSTKRIAERMMQAADRELVTGFSVVRFVNIVGTRGSVIETLAAQIAAGRPLTLTDPGMTRYWITMPEATRLLVQAASHQQTGVVFMPDTGPAIKLTDLARHLCRLLSGNQCDYPIRYIGARPGERMHEVLLSRNESAMPTPYPGILEVSYSRTDIPRYDEISRMVDELLALASKDRAEELRRRIIDLAHSLQ